MSPGEQRELLHVVLVHKREHKPDEPDDVETEWEEPMVGDQHPKVVLQSTILIKNSIEISDKHNNVRLKCSKTDREGTWQDV